MEILFQQALNGLTLGSVYALVALGVTMIFGVLGVVAFAQGGVYMLGAYGGFFVAARLQQYGLIVTLLGALLAGAVTGALANVLIDRVAYRPIRGATRLAPLICGIGCYIFIENAMGAAVGRKVLPYPVIFPSAHFEVLGVHVSAAQLVVIAAAAFCDVALWLLVRRTRMGLHIRAVAERTETAMLMSVNAERVIVATFAISGAFSGVAGVLVGGFVGVVSPSMGFLVGIKAFAAAVIAGIGNVPGALLGGLLVGVVETFAAGYVASTWSDAIVFLMLVATLVVRPAGLIGASSAERA